MHVQKRTCIRSVSVSVCVCVRACVRACVRVCVCVCAYATGACACKHTHSIDAVVQVEREKMRNQQFRMWHELQGTLSPLVRVFKAV